MGKIFRTTLKITAGLAGAVAVYLLAVWWIPYLPHPAEQENEPKTVTGYILTNGVHTDIVLPVVTPYFDWRSRFSPEHIRAKRDDYRYVAIGWGDKGFYLNTPTWADLKVSTALYAASGMGESALHVTFYPDMEEGGRVRRFQMSVRQYRSLIRYIEDFLNRDGQGRAIFIPTDAVYGDTDAFYEAGGSYSLFYTCNTWANGALKAAGQKAAWWTLTDKGIFQYYP